MHSRYGPFGFHFVIIFLNDEREGQIFMYGVKYILPNLRGEKKYGFCTIPHCFWVSTM